MVGTAHYAEEFKRPQVFCLSPESKRLLGAFPLEAMGLSHRCLAHKIPPYYRRSVPFPFSFLFLSILCDCSAQVEGCFVSWQVAGKGGGVGRQEGGAPPPAAAFKVHLRPRTARVRLGHQARLHKSRQLGV